LRAALKACKTLVTPNKNLLAGHGDELFALAVSRNLPIGFEASVAGWIPILRVIQESTAGDRLRAVDGVLNGTANYILTQIERRNVYIKQHKRNYVVEQSAIKRQLSNSCCACYFFQPR
jgi:homoserine dehydrogenase